MYQIGRAWRTALAFSFFVVIYLCIIYGACYGPLILYYMKYFLVVVPQILDLLMIVFSFYLMLDGVWRWGKEINGAFSRTLIGLFILHTSSVDVPFVPYIALLFEIVLCYRNYKLKLEPNTKQATNGDNESKTADLGYSLQG